MTDPAYPTTIVPPTQTVQPDGRIGQGKNLRLVQWLLDHPGTIDMKCERIYDAQVKTATILVGDVEVDVLIDPNVQALITIECPFNGSVDVDWRYQSSLRNGDEEQVGDWTCPVCGESQEVTR